MEQIQSLHRNIEGYLRKHYLGKAIAGSILFVGVSVALWLLFSAIEYTARLDSLPRGILFIGFLIIASAMLISQVALPLLQRSGMFRDMDEREASARIGKGVTEIDDRLTNALTLGGEWQIGSRDLERRALQQGVWERDARPLSEPLGSGVC